MNLLVDNQRATNIIQSLRSIFFDRKIGVERIDVKDLIEAVLKIAQPEIQSKNIQVILKLSSSTLVNINRAEVQQVILNLINNAIQALSDSDAYPRTLKVESRNVSEGVEMLFIDNGSGIPIDKQSHLFELLADSNKKSGMGLGLWLCQHIVSRHGGHIQYKDVPEGGAQFIVLLLADKE